MFASETIQPFTTRCNNIDDYAKEKDTKILDYNKTQSYQNSKIYICKVTKKKRFEQNLFLNLKITSVFLKQHNFL